MRLYWFYFYKVTTAKPTENFTVETTLILSIDKDHFIFNTLPIAQLYYLLNYYWQGDNLVLTFTEINFHFNSIPSMIGVYSYHALISKFMNITRTSVLLFTRCHFLFFYKVDFLVRRKNQTTDVI